MPRRRDLKLGSFISDALTRDLKREIRGPGTEQSIDTNKEEAAGANAGSDEPGGMSRGGVPFRGQLRRRRRWSQMCGKLHGE